MSIADWPKEQRPRERLLALGPAALSYAELLAIFLRVGLPGKNAVELALETLQRFGSQDVGRGLKSLIGALGQDLAATRPSTDASRLQSLLTDMYHLEVAATVLESCGELSDKLAGQGEKPLDSTKLMRDMVGLTNEKWVSESRFTKLAQDHGLASPTTTIAFLNGTRGMLRDLPVQIYADADTRQNLMNALQGALDTAIDAEEE